MEIEGVKSQQIAKKNVVKQEAQEAGKVKQFERMLSKTANPSEKHAKVNEMIDTIDKLKITLDHDLTVENLEKYKNAVRSFLEHYTKNELKMEQHFFKDRRGYQEKLEIIRSADKKLNDLTENMLETHQGHMEMLKKIGEVNGLILNLYV